MWTDDKPTMVLTFYGHAQVIDKIVINSFDPEKRSDFTSEDVAKSYCRNINVLELKEDSWIHAKIVPINTPLYLKTFLPFAFSTVMLELDDLALQKLVKSVETRDLAGALKDVGDDVLEKVRKNMSNQAAQVLKEDMEYLGSTVRPDFIKKCRDSILDNIRYLEAVGEIAIYPSNGIPQGDAHE